MAKQKITKNQLKKKKKGEASQFITRSKAIKKLQLKLKDFRRLCILKGIYPREPKKSKNAVSTKTYYHVKDIAFLAHEKLLSKFRDIKIYLKKMKRAKIRGDKLKAEKLAQNIPQYSLQHLVKERYPSFTDAIRDLDDPLCLISLFSVLPAHKSLSIPRDKIALSIRLQREFNLYIIRSQSLRKVFLSIKGIYYQAEIMGQPVTWITPYQFTQQMPLDVDYKVMSTFLEFYHVLMKFINFKLYQNLNLNYPPDLNLNIEDQEYHSYRAFLLKNNQTLDQQILQKEQDEKYKISEQFQNTAEVQQLTNKDQSINKNLFKGLIFWLNRETPRYSLEFVILAFGGQVYWDSEDDEQQINYDSPEITHCITDREPEQIKFIKNREFIQPQWIYDCINNQILLPVKEYAPGKILPPHLSPFVNNQAEGYTPKRQVEIDNLKSGQQENTNEDLGYNIIQQQDEQDGDEDQNINEDGQEDEEEEEQSDIEVDEGFDFEKEQKKKKQKEIDEKDEQRNLAKAMLTKKNRRLLSKIEYSKEQKKQHALKLEQKAKQIANKIKQEKREKQFKKEKKKNKNK